MPKNSKQDQTEIEFPQWLSWAREIQAISQTGLHFAENEYQRERFQRLSEISAEILGTYTNLNAENFLKIFDNQIGYATPRIDVRGAAFQDGNLLLVRERVDGGWTMPGGWADVGDIPSIAVLIGPPGVGKSTFLREYKKREIEATETIICRDDIVMELGGVERDHARDLLRTTEGSVEAALQMIETERGRAAGG